jgi:ribosomal protein L37AE/L43A
MKSFPKTGKKVRPKTAAKGKRFLCAKCRKRSPKPVKTPAPWYCPKCLKEISVAAVGVESKVDVFVVHSSTRVT